MGAATPPRILFIDAYDSFSHSIVGLIEETLTATVHVIRIDDGETAEDLINLTHDFDAVVVGPGPGNPANHHDVGISQLLWTLRDADLIPVFGICLGFQSMALAFGAQISRLTEARHGYIGNVVHNDSDIFEGVGELQATQYHSLQVTMQHSPEECAYAPIIQPLAYTEDPTNGHVLMALKIRDKPFWGVQFHPESVCTSDNARRLIENWWIESQNWLARNRTTKRHWQRVTAVSHSDERTAPPVSEVLLSRLRAECSSLFPVDRPSISWRMTSAVGLTAVDIYERLDLRAEGGMLLDSQGHSSGRYSIIGIPRSRARNDVTFNAADGVLSVGGKRQNPITFQLQSQKEFWSLIEKIITANAVDTKSGPADVPFWGGFIGYVSYEAGLDTLDIAIEADGCVFFTWISRSVVIDHQTQKVYIQQLDPEGAGWASAIAERIDMLTHCRSKPPSRDVHDLGAVALDRALDHAIVEKPILEEYCNKVTLCKEYLASGESYELCLTDQTEIYLPLSPGTHDSIDEWTLYKRLRSTNPAPFGAFLDTESCTVVGSSPERFLQWTRSGRCQFRPIKGTVKKDRKTDLEAAKKILSSHKEMAENLMIVDLIRHDLSGIVGSPNCFVPKLMQVEEYQTVFQLVSVIEGHLPSCASPGYNGTCRRTKSSTTPSGIDVLTAALPPGSMTGAPKKRSCELLKQLEDKPRGIYSGVLGYLDVGGGGDFSVVIRTAVKRKGELVYKPSQSGTSSALEPHEVWRVGAGGAVTIQSTELGEFEEMETKLDSVLRAFCSG